ncbi:hypothetical protein ACFL3I_03020 [Pseudomonadota bacterium]
MQQIKYWLCICIFLAGLPQILIAEENNNVDEQDRRGITGTYHEGQVPDEMLEMSLARIRQLFAHKSVTHWGCTLCESRTGYRDSRRAASGWVLLMSWLVN